MGADLHMIDRMWSERESERRKNGYFNMFIVDFCFKSYCVGDNRISEHS